jgi:osmoprotectant transport system substrate-binding protein
MKRFHPGTTAALAATVAVGLTLAGCSSPQSLSGGGGGSSESMVVGSANFPENVTLAYIYGGALAAKGVKVSYKVNIGARSVYFPALEKGEINLVPEYAGSILTYLDKKASEKTDADVKDALTSKLPKGLTATEFAPGADSDSLNVTAALAKANGLESIGDLSKLSSVKISANAEFQTRPDGIPGLKSLYGLNNLEFSAIPDGGGPATVKALVDGTTQVADIYSTQPSIEQNKFVTLKDPKSLFASQQVVPIGTSSKLTSTVKAILDKVSAKITTNTLLGFNVRTGGSEKANPKTVARDWLKQNGFSK